MLTTGLRINPGSKKITKRINPMWTKTEADGNQKAAIVLQGGNMVDGELVRFGCTVKGEPTDPKPMKYRRERKEARAFIPPGQQER